MEIKTALYYLLLNYSLEPNAMSQIPIQLKKNPLMLQAEKGMHMELKPRQKQLS